MDNCKDGFIVHGSIDGRRIWRGFMQKADAIEWAFDHWFIFHSNNLNDRLVVVDRSDPSSMTEIACIEGA